MDQTENDKPRSSLMSRHGLVLIGFLAVAGYFLWTEHEAHLRALVPYLPWLLLLACPLMHIFMHGGHGHDHGPNDTRHKPQDGREQ
jgi:hypothetical protein